MLQLQTLAQGNLSLKLFKKMQSQMSKKTHLFINPVSRAKYLFSEKYLDKELNFLMDKFVEN